MRSISQLILMVVLVSFSALLTEKEAEAATYYVATTGDDTNGNGSITAPWRTVPKGIRSLHAGDTLYIRGGTYALSASYGSVASDTYGCQSGCPTSWAGATSIRNYPGEAVLITNSGFNMDQGISTGGVAYVIFEGDKRANFIIDGQQNQWANGFRVNQSVHHIRMKTMTVRNFYSDGIKGGATCSTTNRPAFIEVVDMMISGNGDNLNNNGSGEYHEHGIYPSCGTNWLIRGNHFFNNWAFGISVYAGAADYHTNYVITNNIVEGRRGPLGTAAGIYVNAGGGHLIANNIVIAKGSADNTLQQGISHGSTAVAPQTYNNTIYGLPIGMQIETSSGSVIRNNLFSAIGAVNIKDLGSNTKANNLCTISEAGCSVISTSVNFVMPGSNFHLSAGSPAIDAGATISAVTTDFDGGSRPAGNAYDIGAFESGTTSATALAPPRNLQVR